MSYESQFHLVLMVSNRNKPNQWESTASPNSLALKMDMSSVQVGGNVDQIKDNAWLWSIRGNESKETQIDTRRRSRLFEIICFIVI